MADYAFPQISRFVRADTTKPNIGTVEPILVSEETRQKVNRILQNVDSIRLRWPITMNYDQYADVLKDHWIKNKKGFQLHEYGGSMRTSQNSVISITYMPYVINLKRSCLYLEFSIPKLLTGNNYEDELQVDDIISRVEVELASVSVAFQILPLGILSASICRIDICKNFQVGDEVSKYIEFLKTRSYPRRCRVPYQNNERGRKKSGEKDNGVSFQSKQITTLCYDKEEECGDPNSRGILRLEVQYKGSRAIKKLTSERGCEANQGVRLGDLKYDIVREVIEREISILGLDAAIVIEDDFREQLKRNFSGRKVGALTDYARCEYQNPGLNAEQLAKIIGCSKATVNNYRQELREKGLAYNGSRKASLPPLRFEWKDEE